MATWESHNFSMQNLVKINEKKFFNLVCDASVRHMKRLHFVYFHWFTSTVLILDRPIDFESNNASLEKAKCSCFLV